MAMARSAQNDQLIAAVDTVPILATPQGTVLRFVALLDGDLPVHNATALRAVADGSVGTAVIAVVARVRTDERRSLHA